jgi:hypothetical protein
MPDASGETGTGTDAPRTRVVIADDHSVVQSERVEAVRRALAGEPLED